MKPTYSPPAPDLATEILQYLLRHPAAEDTIEGIVHWWLVEERLFQAMSQVRGALAQLHQEGLVISRTLTDGRVLYRLDPNRHDAATTVLRRLQSVSAAAP